MPQHAKRLLMALNDNITKFEDMFGTIEIHEGKQGFPMNFGGPVGEA